MSDAQANEAEKNIEIWKVKKLIKRLEAARGNGTSMISLIIRKYHCHNMCKDVFNSVSSAKGPSLACGQDVGRRICALAPHFALTICL
jgi:peptide chain release factor subunit 1